MLLCILVVETKEKRSEYGQITIDAPRVEFGKQANNSIQKKKKSSAFPCYLSYMNLFSNNFKNFECLMQNWVAFSKVRICPEGLSFCFREINDEIE